MIMLIGMTKRLLLCVWDAYWNTYYRIRDVFFYSCDYVVRSFVPTPSVMSLQSTISHIVATRCSVARFGDGEIKLCSNIDLGFQKAAPSLCSALRTVLANGNEGLLVCVPGVFGNLDCYMKHERNHWTKHLSYYRLIWYKYMNRSSKYGEAFISRFYMPYKDKSVAARSVKLWKQVWNNRDLLIVEGEKSRLGVGNDLFDNARTIKRILAPNKDAYSYYSHLFSETLKYDTTHLVLLALGPTATVLTSDLCKHGYQAIDIGHIDIEYEWMLMGAEHKVPVMNKFVNEAGGGIGVGEFDDEKYLSEIVCRVVNDGGNCSNSG